MQEAHPQRKSPLVLISDSYLWLTWLVMHTITTTYVEQVWEENQDGASWPKFIWEKSHLTEVGCCHYISKHCYDYMQTHYRQCPSLTESFL